MTKRIALLAGATGQIGAECLQLLLENTAYAEVHVVARGPANIEHPKLFWRQLNFAALDTADLSPIDDAFCTLGVRRGYRLNSAELRLAEFEYPLAVANLAKRCGAKRFLTVTSVAADPSSIVGYLRLKGRLEADLQKLNFQSLDIFRPSFLAGERGITTVANALLAGPLRKYRAVEPITVADAMLNAALNGRPGARIHHFGGCSGK